MESFIKKVYSEILSYPPTAFYLIIFIFVLVSPFLFSGGFFVSVFFILIILVIMYWKSRWLLDAIFYFFYPDHHPACKLKSASEIAKELAPFDQASLIKELSKNEIIYIGHWVFLMDKWHFDALLLDDITWVYVHSITVNLQTAAENAVIIFDSRKIQHTLRTKGINEAQQILYSLSIHQPNAKYGYHGEQMDPTSYNEYINSNEFTDMMK